MFNFAPAIPSRTDLDWCWYLRRQGRAGEALERALHDIGVMDPGGWADWDSSLLTDTGAPVEMVFSTNETALQLTAEVANPGANATTRVAQVCDAMKMFGGRAPSAALRDVISAAQSAAELRFGARLGLRQGANRIDTTLYAEMPAEAADLSKLVAPMRLGPLQEKLGESTRVTMLGYNGTSGQITIYCEAEGAMRTILPTLADPAQVSADVLSMSIDGLTDTAPQMTLPTRKLGFSYTITGEDTPPVLSLYFSSKEMFETDAAISRRVKSCGGRAMTGYASLADNLAPAPVGTTHHGQIGLTARQGAAPILTIGVAAPWHCPFDGL